MNEEITLRPADWERDMPLIRQVREAVFIREQRVDPALEWDEYETSAQHFLALRGDEPLATGRITADGKIGRMAVMQHARGLGLGFRLLRAICEHAQAQGVHKVYLHAQTHALPFYRKAGFEVVGEEFMEAGIPHRKMVRRFSHERPAN